MFFVSFPAKIWFHFEVKVNVIVRALESVVFSIARMSPLCRMRPIKSQSGIYSRTHTEVSERGLPDVVFARDSLNRFVHEPLWWFCKVTVMNESFM